MSEGGHRRVGFPRGVMEGVGEGGEGDGRLVVVVARTGEGVVVI